MYVQMVMNHVNLATLLDSASALCSLCLQNLCSEQNVFHKRIDEVASEYQNRLSYYKYDKQQVMRLVRLGRQIVNKSN